MLPAFVGMGIGRRLFLQVASESPSFTFTSDPHADGFYMRMGARVIGKVASDISRTPAYASSATPESASAGRRLILRGAYDVITSASLA